MDAETFLKRLFVLFPPETSYQETLEFYLDAFETSKEYDYRKLLRIVSREYTYKTLPTTAWLLNMRTRCIPDIKESYSGNEGNVIKRVINGIGYEFTIVPNHWDRVKTIRQLDEEIAFRNTKQSEG